MATTLILGAYDLCNPASNVRLADGWDRGAPQPVLADIASSVLDGSQVSGLAASNRTFTIPLLILATTRAGLATLANQVLTLVNQQSWTLAWTPNGGTTVVYDCFRATTEIESAPFEDEQLCQRITVTCEALPYGRSTNPQSFTLTGTVVVVDDFSTVPTVTPSAWSTAASTTTTVTYHGGSATQLTAPSSTYGTTVSTVTMARAGLSVSLASTTAAMSFEFYQSNAFGFGAGNVPWTLAVTVGGTVYTATSTQIPGCNVWSPVTFAFATPIPSGTLTAWTLSFMSWAQRSFPDSYVIDYLLAYPAAGVRASSTNGTEYVLPTVAGSARAPSNLQLTAPSGTFSQFCVHSPPSDTPDSQVLVPVQSTASPVTVNAVTGTRYKGTYSVYCSIKWGPSVFPGVGASIPLTITQGGSSVTLTHIVTTAENAVSSTYLLLYFGEATLPVLDFPTSANSTTSFTVTSGATSFTVGEILMLDTRGQTILSDSGAPAALNVYVNEPALGTSFGSVYSSTGTLPTALSITGHLVTGSSLFLYPPGGTARLMVWTAQIAPTAALTYTPRWIQEATV